MKYFTQLQLPTYPEMLSELNGLLNEGKISWGESGQVCLNTTINAENDYTLGTASLDYDWSNAVTITENGISRVVVPKKAVPLRDIDFNVLCDQFKHTIFSEVYELLNQRYHIGRVRLIKSEVKTCMSWHIDHSRRIHYPLLTQTGCKMVIDDEVMHIPQDTWWMTDTTKYHTAFNASSKSRIHLVVCLIE